MAAAYSARFIVFPGGSGVYVVPAGKRAVVRCITLANSNAGAAAFTFWIGTYRVLRFNVAGASGEVHGDMHVVVDAGEDMSIGYDAGVQGSISGYLLGA